MSLTHSQLDATIELLEFAAMGVVISPKTAKELLVPFRQWRASVNRSLAAADRHRAEIAEAEGRVSISTFNTTPKRKQAGTAPALPRKVDDADAGALLAMLGIDVGQQPTANSVDQQQAPE